MIDYFQCKGQRTGKPQIQFRTKGRTIVRDRVFKNGFPSYVSAHLMLNLIKRARLRVNDPPIWAYNKGWSLE